MANPPSPTTATLWRFGYVNRAAIANGRPGAIVASIPGLVKRCPSRTRKCRAAKNVFDPQSSEITASGAIRSLSARSTICGRRGERFHAFYLVEELQPALHSPLCFCQKVPVCLMLQEPQKRRESRLYIAYQAKFGRIAKPDMIGLDIDLNGACTALLRIGIDPWHR